MDDLIALRVDGLDSGFESRGAKLDPRWRAIGIQQEIDRRGALRYTVQKYSGSDR